MRSFYWAWTQVTLCWWTYLRFVLWLEEKSQDHACLVHKLLSQYAEGQSSWVEKYPTDRHVPKVELLDVPVVCLQGFCLSSSRLNVFPRWNENWNGEFCLWCAAAPWCGPGGGTLSSAGRGAASAENVGGSQVRCSPHQLWGHSVRPPFHTASVCNVGHSKLNVFFFFRVHIIFSSLKKFSKFEVIFSVGVSDHLYVLHVQSFRNRIGTTTWVWLHFKSEGTE